MKRTSKINTEITNPCNTPRSLTHVQSCSVMVILDKINLSIIGYSENLTKLGLPGPLDKLSDILKKDVNTTTDFLLKAGKIAGDTILILKNDKSYYCHYYKTDGAVIIELEEKNEDLSDDIDYMFDFINELLVNDENQNDICSLLEIINKLTNYERILVYKFQKDWSGEVIGEYIKSLDYPKEIDSYMGKFFPDTDIPEYVRRLFYRNKSRFISSTVGEGEKVIFLQKDLQELLDTSMSDMITPAKSHTRYLESLGIKSSFSLALIVNSKLWGVVACHSLSKEVYISPKKRKYCSKISNIFSDKLAKFYDNENQRCHSLLYDIYEIAKAFDNFSKEELYNIYYSIIKVMTKHLKADYTVLSSNGDLVYIEGSDGIPENQWQTVYNCLINKLSDSVIITSCARKDLGIDNKQVCGVIAIKLHTQENWIAFIKKEKIETNVWAGRGVQTVNNEILPRQDFNDVEILEYDKSSKWENVNSDDISELKDLLVNFLTKNELEMFVNEKNSIEKKQNIIITNLTHEIRNPLNAIKGIFDILKEDADTDGISSIEKNDISSIIDDGIKVVDLLKNLIDNMIDFTKNKYGYTSIYMKKINLASIIKDLYNVYRYSVKRGVVLSVDLDSRIPKELVGDKDKMIQIISNLLSNSCKYTNKGHIKISARIINSTTTNVYWTEITIEDTGIGIAEEKQYLIFREFEQLNSISRSGSGLGLSIVHQLVTMLNGTVAFESEFDWGTTFKVRIPFTCIQPEEILSVIEKEQYENTEKIKILVVDDTIINQKILKIKLEKLGYNVTCADNGQKAVELVKDGNKFGVILMDIFMPILDGIEATKIIRETYNYDGIIIGVSGNENIKEKFSACKLDDFILKPIDFSKFGERIKSHLEKYKI